MKVSDEVREVLPLVVLVILTGFALSVSKKIQINVCLAKNIFCENHNKMTRRYFLKSDTPNLLFSGNLQLQESGEC